MVDHSQSDKCTRTAPHVEVRRLNVQFLDVAACANLGRTTLAPQQCLVSDLEDDLARGGVCQDVALGGCRLGKGVAPPDDRDERAPGDGVGDSA